MFAVPTNVEQLVSPSMRELRKRKRHQLQDAQATGISYVDDYMRKNTHKVLLGLGIGWVCTKV